MTSFMVFLKDVELNSRFIFGEFNIGFGGFTAVTMTNAVFWDVVPCKSCVNRRFGGTQDLHGATSQKTIFVSSI
jgi:hypothetical protein